MKKIIILLLCCGVFFLMSCQQQTTVDDVVNMMTEATGGAEALAGLTDRVITLEFTMHVMPPGAPEGDEGPITLPVTLTGKRPNKVRWDFYEPGGSIFYTLCYDGTTGRAMDMGQRTDMTEAQLQELESLAATFFDDYLNYQDKGFTLELLRDETIDEKNYLVLHVTDKHGNIIKCYINPDTHFIERRSGNMVNNAGEWEFIVMTFKDYKMVNGIAFPYHMVQHNATGEIILEITVKEVKHNTGVDDAVFRAEVM
jgi:outer membrane lipoprotein-sorting protein